MPQNVELGSAKGRCMRAGLILSAIEADATSQGCPKSGAELADTITPAIRPRPMEVEGGRLGKGLLVPGFISSPCAHWGCTGGPRAPLPGSRNPHSCLMPSRGPSLDSPSRYIWCPLLPWGPEPGTRKRLRVCLSGPAQVPPHPKSLKQFHPLHSPQP